MDSIKTYNIEKNTEEIKNEILKNIIKMLAERNFINKENIDKNIKKLVDKESIDLIWELEVDHFVNKDDKIFAIKFISQKITAVNKALGISDYLNNYKSNHKILVVKEISKKAYQYILNNYQNTEVFREDELLINIVDHILVPKHEVLTEEEQNNFFKDYNCTKKNMPKILSTDPIARYYNMQPGQICRIIRPSETSGYTTCYRLVVKGFLK